MFFFGNAEVDLGHSNFLFCWCCEFIFSDIADLILKRTNLGSFVIYFYAWGYPRGIMSLTMFMSKSLHNHSSTHIVVSFNIILKVAAYITQSSCVSHYTLYSQLEGSVSDMMPLGYPMHKNIEWKTPDSCVSESDPQCLKIWIHSIKKTKSKSISKIDFSVAKKKHRFSWFYTH